jgi:hypothetical protein
LVDLFPATRAAQQAIATQDVRAIAPPGDTPRLELLTAAATQIDPMLQNAAEAEMKRQGHKYSKIKLEETAKVLFGNDYAKDAKDPGTRHDFNDMLASGDARAICGDRVGFDKSFLD